MMCFDCEQEGDEDDPGCGHPVVYCSCYCHEPPVDDPDDERSMPCMGAECCNPDPFHHYDECVTVEMMQANEDTTP